VEVNAFDTDVYAQATRQLSRECSISSGSNYIWVATEDGRQLDELQLLLQHDRLLVKYTNCGRYECSCRKRGCVGKLAAFGPVQAIGYDQ
jgi:hypothetical protein